MSGVRILHFLKDWWKFIQIHQYYTMALKVALDIFYFQIYFIELYFGLKMIMYVFFFFITNPD